MRQRILFPAALLGAGLAGGAGAVGIWEAVDSEESPAVAAPSSSPTAGRRPAWSRSSRRDSPAVRPGPGS
jgi:hypothetical protein